MSLALRFRVQRQIYDLSDLLATDRWFAASPRGYLTEPHQSLFLELTTTGQLDPDHLTDFRIGHTVRSPQQHLSSLHHAMRRDTRTDQGF